MSVETAERPETPLAAARLVWGRAVAQIEVGTLTRHDYEAAEDKLRAIRGTLEAPEQGRIDLYLELLEHAWADRSPRPVRQARTSQLVVRAHRVLAAAFAEGGDRPARQARARAALRELERLAGKAGDDLERLSVVRLADPLLRLLAALEEHEHDGEDEVLQ